jgi:hypothetical protein
VDLTTHLLLAPWMRMGAVICLRPLYDVMTWTRTTVPFIHIPFKTGFVVLLNLNASDVYRGADKSLARTTSRCILFDGENISFDASLVIYIYIVLIFLQLCL